MKFCQNVASLCCQTICKLEGTGINRMSNRLVLMSTKFFFSNWVCDICNVLPSNIAESSSSAMFQRLLDNVDFSEFATLC